MELLASACFRCMGGDFAKRKVLCPNDASDPALRAINRVEAPWGGSPRMMRDGAYTIYARISQDRGREGLGVKRQLADCRAEAAR